MAAVIFIVTIPTENEENRLNGEFSENLIPSSTPENEKIHLHDPAQKSDSKPAQQCITSSTAILDAEISSMNEDCLFTTPCGTYDSIVVSQENFNTINQISSDIMQDVTYSGKPNMDEEVQQPNDLNISPSSSMEIVMREIFKYLQIQNGVWTKSVDERMYQIIFTTEFNETCGVFEKFNEWGIGERKGSSVSAINCIASKMCSSNLDENFSDKIYHQNIATQKQGMWERFMNSVRSRLNVAQIVREVRQDAAISFDFIILLISAAIVASFGLIENSTVFLASSMLISPLMGPIIAAIFGKVIKDPSLQSLGLRNEICGILMTVCVGFIFGLVLCISDRLYNITDGLTTEMLSRCEFHSLIVGALIAVPSGAAAAVAILGGNTGSLAGVAISASLLPPAVNSGLLWALAITCKLYKADDFHCNSFVQNKFYSTDNATELAVLGCISMCLTISNVICIYIIGIIVLKIKEIAPTFSHSERQFWKTDIKVARDLNKNNCDTDSMICNEFDALYQDEEKVLRLDCDIWRTMNLKLTSNQKTWSHIVEKRLPLDLHLCNYNTVAYPPSNQLDRIKPSYTNSLENMQRICRLASNDFIDSPISIHEASSYKSIFKRNENKKKHRKFLVTPVFEHKH